MTKDSSKLPNQTLQEIYDQLSQISYNQDADNEKVEQPDNQWATGHGINKVLTKILGNSAHIIDPDLSSIESPASSNEKNRLKGSINYINNINGFLQGQPIDKPIVMIINTDVAVASSPTDTKASGGSHWQTCVIIPKNYITPLGININNQNEQIFFIDSLNENQTIPESLKLLLTTNFEYIFTADNNPHTKQITAPFPNAEFINCTNVLQQEGGEDCGFWAVYNALMFVLTGKNDFVNQFKQRSRAPAYKLRELWPDLTEQAQVGNYSNSKDKSNMTKTSDEINSDNDTRFQATIYDNLKLDGLRKSLHGNLYQLCLLILVAHRAHLNKEEFYLISEAQGFEKFDDLVIDRSNHILFLQAKHSYNKGEKYTKSDLKNGNDGDASLAKYFDSWYSLKKGPYTKTTDGKDKSSTYIFFSNKFIESGEQFLEKIALDQNDEFLFKDLPLTTWRFKKGTSRNEFIDAILCSSECVKKSEKVSVTENDLAKLDKKYVKEAAEYLLNHSGKKELRIDGRSNLDPKTMALIKIALSNDNALNLILSKIQDNKKNTLQNWFKKNKITVNIGNAEVLLSKIKPLEKEVEQFLDDFIIQVDESEITSGQTLADMIAKEFALDTNIGPMELYNSVHKKMLEWFSGKKCVLRFDGFNEFIHKTIQDLDRFYLLGSTQLFEQECQQSFLNIDSIEINGLEILLKGQTTNFITINDKHGGIKQRLYQTIKKLKKEGSPLCKNDSCWAFITIGSPYLDNKVHSALENDATKLIIIDCRTSKLDQSLYNELQKLAAIVSKKSKKLILLYNDPDFAQKISKLIQYNIGKLEIEPLTDEQLDKILKPHIDKKISLAGKDISIGDIRKLKNCIFELMRNSDYMAEVIHSISNNTTKATNVQMSTMPYDIYTPNNLVRGIPQYNLLILLQRVNIKLFIIRCVNYKIESIQKEVQNEIISKKGQEQKYQVIQDIGEIQNSKKDTKCIIFTDKEDIYNDTDSITIKVGDNLDSAIILSNPSNTVLPITVRYIFPEGDASLENTDINRGVSVLSAGAGFGKSSYAINYRDSWIKRKDIQEGPSWVIRINLAKLKFKRDNVELYDAFTPKVTEINWEPWQLEALSHDMKIVGRVILLLDGFDEIKNEDIIKKFNTWIKKVPAETSLFITTRPHAANKIVLPETQSKLNYLTLKQYTYAQRKQYIESYINYICKDEKRAQQISGVLLKSVTDRTSRILGIPLESFLFCEAMKPEILKWYENKDNMEDLHIDNKFNAVLLYQKFLRTKFQLYLEKHMDIKPFIILQKPNRIYTYTAVYNDIISVFAFRQAFSLPYSFINESLRSVRYSNDDIITLSEIGLLTVEQEEGEYFLKFNHETYQEYFAASYLLYCLIDGVGNKKYEQAKEKIIEYRYIPRYRNIIVMLAQLSLAGDPSLPSWNTNDHDQKIKDFWYILCLPGDSLGAASYRLYIDCIEELLPDQLVKLKKIIGLEEWSKNLVYCIDNISKNQNKQDIELPSNEAPVLLANDNNTSVVPITLSEYEKENLKWKLRDKKIVVKETQAAINKGIARTELASLFEKIILEDTYHYWDIDGGFEAMALLGDSFTENLADYFIMRINKDYSWRRAPALGAISHLLKLGLKNNEARFAAAKVLWRLANYYNDNSFYSASSLFQVIRSYSSTYLEFLKKNLLNVIENKDFLSYSFAKRNINYASLPQVIDRCFDILIVCYKLGYAINYNDCKNSICIVADNVTDFIIPDGEKGNIGQIIIQGLFSILDKNVKQNMLFFADLDKSKILELFKQDNGIYFKFEQKLLSTILHKNTFDDICPEYKGDAIIFCKVLDEYNLLTRENVEKLVANDDYFYRTDNLRILITLLHKYGLLTEERIKELRDDDIFFDNRYYSNFLIELLAPYNLLTEKIVEKFAQDKQWEEKGKAWARDCGIEAVGYVGKYFNKSLADNLLNRAEMWYDNRDAAISSLKNIKKELEGLKETQLASKDSELLNRAIEAYNQCIKEMKGRGYAGLKGLDEIPCIKAAEEIIKNGSDLVLAEVTLEQDDEDNNLDTSRLDKISGKFNTKKRKREDDSAPL